MKFKQAHEVALAVSATHANLSEAHKRQGRPGRALAEKARAVIVYDRTMAHWSMESNASVAVLLARISPFRRR